MGAPYIPARDVDLDAWGANFATVLTANPANFGIVAADATNVTNSYNSYHGAYLLAADPSTRTPATVAAKDVQKAAALIVWRGYANLIQANVAVSDANKAAAGLTVRATGRTPIPTPGTNPVNAFLRAGVGTQDYKYSDSSTPTTKKKPYGVIAAEIYVAIAVGAVSDPALGIFNGLATKSPFQLAFNHADAGKTATVFTRWVTRTNKVGPWSPAVSATIVA